MAKVCLSMYSSTLQQAFLSASHCGISNNDNGVQATTPQPQPSTKMEKKEKKKKVNKTEKEKRKKKGWIWDSGMTNNKACASSPLAILEGEAWKGIVRLHLVELPHFL